MTIFCWWILWQHVIQYELTQKKTNGICYCFFVFVILSYSTAVALYAMQPGLGGCQIFSISFFLFSLSMFFFRSSSSTTVFLSSKLAVMARHMESTSLQMLVHYLKFKFTLTAPATVTVSGACKPCPHSLRAAGKNRSWLWNKMFAWLESIYNFFRFRFSVCCYTCCNYPVSYNQSIDVVVRAGVTIVDMPVIKMLMCFLLFLCYNWIIDIFFCLK